MSPNILANTVWFKPGLKSWVRQTALIVYLENSLALRLNPEPFPLPEIVRHYECHLCLLHFVLSLSRINSTSPEYHNWPATSSRGTMTFSSASSVIGCYIPRFSSKCSRLDNYSDLYQTSKFCRGPCCRFRATSDADLTSLIQNQMLRLLFLPMSMQCSSLLLRP
jgi:hypothetical protein